MRIELDTKVNEAELKIERFDEMEENYNE